MMRVSTRLLCAMFAFVNVTATGAQTKTEVFEKHNNYYISFGAGSSVLRELPEEIYFSGSNNLQLGLLYERAFHKHFSFITGAEFEQVTYSFDGDIHFNSTTGFDLIAAGTDKKYTGLRQRNIAIPLQVRFYLLENTSPEERNMFIQSGVRITQTLDFAGSEALQTHFYYRSNGENESHSLSDYTNQTSLQWEFMIGFKNQFFKNFDLLNASSLGFIYQLNPMFKDNSSDIYPMHFTWRFLF